LAVSNLECEGIRGELKVTVKPRAVKENINIAGGEICAGGNITLSPSSDILDSTFYWYNSQKATTPLSDDYEMVLTGLMRDTTFYVGVTGTGYCENDTNNRKPVTVHVKPRPAVTNTTGGIVCDGGTTDIELLSDPDGATFEWTVENQTNTTSGAAGSGNTIAQKLDLTPPETSGSVTYRITPTLNACEGEYKDITVTITNSINPAFNLPKDTVCPGITKTYKVTPKGTSYTWTLPDKGDVLAGGNAGSDSITVTWLNTTLNALDDTIRVVVVGGDCVSSAPAMVTVHIKPNPTVTTATGDAICNGETTNIVLTSAPAGATFIWTVADRLRTTSGTGGSGSIITQTLNLTFPETSGIVTYRVIPSLNGCTGAYKDIPVAITVCELIDCEALLVVNRTAEENTAGAGIYTHTGFAWDAIPLTTVDSMQYYIHSNLISSGIAATLNGAEFPVGNSKVTVIAYYGDTETTCEFYVKVTHKCPPSVRDDENNLYKVTHLVGLCWTENLKATKYAINQCPDQDSIPFAKPYYSTVYSNTDTNTYHFGLLYDWYSAMGIEMDCPDIVPNQGICPEGWRIPTREEWDRLDQYSAQSLMSKNYWSKPGTDDFGFDARPAGWYNGAKGRFEGLYATTNWWASDDVVGNNQLAHYFYLAYYCNIIREETMAKGMGLSVRCVMEWEE
jgi:uncharacterized protein (TIGR02145 family)